MDIKKETLETCNLTAESYFRRTDDNNFYIKEFDYFKGNISGQEIIDLGCGTGRDAVKFLEEGFNYTGVDISEAMLEIAIKNVNSGKFYNLDFTQTTFVNDMFDGFWAAASFLHIPKEEIGEVLQEAKRITKNNGLGFISLKEGNLEHDGMIVDKRHAGRRRYFSYWDKEEFAQVLNENGYVVVKIDARPYKETNTNWLCYFVKIKK